jgi:hypothetical protein
MSATLTQQYGLGTDQAFIERVSMALLAYAYQVETEAPATTNHAARLAFANKVVLNPDQYAPNLAALIAAVDATAQTNYASTTPPSAANVTDAEIAADVIIGYNLLAGL